MLNNETLVEIFEADFAKGAQRCADPRCEGPPHYIQTIRGMKKMNCLYAKWIVDPNEPDGGFWSTNRICMSCYANYSSKWGKDHYLIEWPGGKIEA